MNIVLARIDDRLIHGQVATIWTKETRCSRIIVCNDDVANDEIRKTLLTQVAPPGIKAHVVDLAKAVRVYKNSKYENDRVMFLFTNPSDVLTLVENGVDIKSVNIGGMSFKEGKKQITGAVSVNDKDIEAFKKLNEKGIELEIRKVSTDSKVDIMPLIQKL
ncbi:mannose/fructose/sorbose PTS transporter subunit IIB [Haloimpatiens massiliensis]|uniref:mannose/fructose/sorbose PTS transporter subunit IIB n=1 Tax=Haloimpatiens massiliensis TaxID=1658110 RepID=UPI000C84EECC|nr:mannose/fructose/sorbose PTS transporter subunit IIB [Haloimpatiens massiliensis]